jgi:hypothetical protein
LGSVAERPDAPHHASRHAGLAHCADTPGPWWSTSRYSRWRAADFAAAGISGLVADALAAAVASGLDLDTDAASGLDAAASTEHATASPSDDDGTAGRVGTTPGMTNVGRRSAASHLEKEPSMSSPAVEALRKALTEVQDALKPELRGLHNMVNDPFSPEALAAINEQIAVLTALDAAIQTALNSLDGLDTAGFPEIPPMQVSDGVLAELNREKTDVADAVDSRFTDIPVASGGSISVPSTPVPKPEP